MRRLTTAITVLAAIVAVLAATQLEATRSGFSASVANSINNAGSASQFTCQGAESANPGALEQYPLTEPTGSSLANDASGHGNSGTYHGSMVSDTSSAVACPRDALGAYVLDGSTSFVSTPIAVSDPTTFSLETWFKTSTTTGGLLMGFGNSQSGLSGAYDRHVYMDDAGHLYFGVYPGRVAVIESPKSYNDGAWHQVVATFSSAGMYLYVDGALVASNTAVTTAQNYSGWWRLGYDNLNGWTNKPSDRFFKGEMRFAAVYSQALSASQVSVDFTAGSSTTVKESESSSCPSTFVTQPGLATGYSLSDPTGSTSAVDLSGTGNGGAYQGSMVSDTSGAQPCPNDTAGALVLNGSSTYVSTANVVNNPTTFTLETWFKTTTSSGGLLMGFGNAQTGTSGEYDRHVYMDNSGHLVFGVYPGYTATIQSPGTYNDGAWHQVVATLSSAGMFLYVDGTQVASDPSNTSAQTFSGYWRLGYDNLNGWPSKPASDYFVGNLADVAIFPSALSAQSVATLYSATSSSAESQAILALNPSAFWPLNG